MTTSNKSGFTLLELLIVILIIGLLSAISIPMYKKAVEKSKVSDALSTMQAVSKSEHGWYLVKNNYTKDFANLDIDLYDKDGNKAEDESFDSINYTYELLDTGILATRTNGEYSIYQDYDTKQIMCTPGTHFICDDLGAFTKEPCEKVGLAWANTNSTCYANEEARCKGLHGEDTWNGEFCGYTNRLAIYGEGMECQAGTGWHGCNGSTFTAGGKCVATGTRSCNGVALNDGECSGTGGQPCWNVIIKEGGVCSASDAKGNPINPSGCDKAKIYNGVCSGDCRNSTVYEGGICSGLCWSAKVYGGECSGNCASAEVSDGGVCSGTCGSAKINDGGICKSSSTNGCKNNTYTGTGCCCGDYCGNAPKCADSVCANI